MRPPRGGLKLDGGKTDMAQKFTSKPTPTAFQQRAIPLPDRGLTATRGLTAPIRDPSAPDAITRRTARCKH